MWRRLIIITKSPRAADRQVYYCRNDGETVGYLTKVILCLPSSSSSTSSITFPRRTTWTCWLSGTLDTWCRWSKYWRIFLLNGRDLDMNEGNTLPNPYTKLQLSGLILIYNVAANLCTPSRWSRSSQVEQCRLWNTILGRWRKYLQFCEVIFQIKYTYQTVTCKYPKFKVQKYFIEVLFTGPRCIVTWRSLILYLLITQQWKFA